MEVINYKNSLVALANSLLKYYGISPFHETLNEIDDLLKQNKYQKLRFARKFIKNCNVLFNKKT